MTDPVLSDGQATMVPGISERANGTTKFSHLDRLGTNAKTTDATGAVVDSRSYDAFGLPIAVTNPTSSQKGFASAFGYQEDSETGLKLLGHRYYDPGSGRFITRDPSQEGTNWYAYCGNNPVNCVHPDGLKVKFIGGTFAQRIAVLAALANLLRTNGYGHYMANDVLYGEKEYEIEFVSNQGSDRPVIGSTVRININDMRDWQYRSKDGNYEYLTWEHLLAHELGHLFDPNAGEQKVTDDYENLVRELEQPQRGDYYDTKDVPPRRRRKKIPFPSPYKPKVSLR